MTEPAITVLYSVPASPQLTGDATGNLGDTSNIAVKVTPLAIIAGTNPYQLATVGNNIYVANEGSGMVSVINSQTNQVTQTINVGIQPYGVAYATSTKEIYVTNIVSGTVSVIDADPTSGTYNTVTYTIPVELAPSMLPTWGAKFMYPTTSQAQFRLSARPAIR